VDDVNARIDAQVAIWHIRAGGMKLSPNESSPALLRLQVCEDVRFVLDRDAADTAGQAAAMRRLAELATEAAEDLERHAAERKVPGNE
jgi:hypothetical protein